MFETCPWSSSQVTGVPQELLVPVVKPDLPTTADLYVLPADSKAPARRALVEKVGSLLQENVENVRQAQMKRP